MLFLTQSSSARRTMLALLLVLCCLSCVLGAKISRKVEKLPNEVKAEESEAIAAAVADAAAPSNVPEQEEEEKETAADEEDDEDDDEDDDDDEEEEAAAAAAAAKQKKQKKPVKLNKDTAVAATTTSNKNELQPGTDLTVWGMVRTLWDWLRSDLGESLFADDDDEKPTKATTSAVEGRTFGKIRRLQMALIPIIFKFGVLSAMVAFLVAIGMKSLFLLKVLVLMNAFAILGKFLTLKTSLFGQFENAAPNFSYPGWNPHAKESWAPSGPTNYGPPAHPPSKEIHLHIHGNAQTQAQLAEQAYSYDQGTQGWASRSDPYSAYPTGQYQTQSQIQQQQQPQPVYAELPNNTNPINLLPTKYPARYLVR